MNSWNWGSWAYNAYKHLIPHAVNFPGDGKSSCKHHTARKERFLAKKRKASR